MVATGLPSTNWLKAMPSPSLIGCIKKSVSLSGKICFLELWRKPPQFTTLRPNLTVKKLVVAQFYARLRDANPAPTTELHYATPFQLLIAVILSAQATDVGVNKATARLFPAAPTPESMLALGAEGLLEYIKTIGLFRTKAKNVIATCRMLLERHGGEVPAERAALEALKGVGRKTANVVINTDFGQATIAVDKHIFRLGK